MKCKNGFTLVELLVVISIIALLLAVLMPALSQARKQAQKIICGSNTRQMGIALQSYTVENGGRLPYTTHYYYGYGSLSGSVKDFSYAWFATLSSYLAPKFHYDNTLTNPEKYPRLKIYECPSRKEKIRNTDIKIAALDYAVNYGGQYGLFPQSHWPVTGMPPSKWAMGASKNPATSIYNVRNPSQVMAVMDSAPQPYGTNYASRMWIYSAFPMPSDPDKLSWWWTINYDWDGDNMIDSNRNVLNTEGVPYNGIGVRHPSAVKAKSSGKANVIFVDGHTESVGTKEFQYSKYWVW